MERVCLGTWQFESMNILTASKLIEVAHKTGIHAFDTAAVYAGGQAEQILGEHTTLEDQITTKIPATSKNADSLSVAYPYDHMADQMASSTGRLRRPPHTILLHNWRLEWENDEGISVLKELRSLADIQGIPNIGISLPNGYDGTIEASETYDIIDVLELPLNTKSPELTHGRIASLALSKQVLIRSLFQHGRDIGSMKERLKSALDTGAHVVIGASKPEQIREWRELCH